MSVTHDCESLFLLFCFLRAFKLISRGSRRVVVFVEVVVVTVVVVIVVIVVVVIVVTNALRRLIKVSIYTAAPGSLYWWSDCFCCCQIGVVYRSDKNPRKSPLPHPRSVSEPHGTVTVVTQSLSEFFHKRNG